MRKFGHFLRDWNKGELPIERSVECRYCHKTGTIQTAMSEIVRGVRWCQNCGQQVMIADDVPMTRADYDRLYPDDEVGA